MELKIKVDVGALQAALDAQAKQALYGVAVALTRTGKDVQAELKAEMKRVFDRPTPFSVNSVFFSAATKGRLESRVWIEGSDRPNFHLLPQIYGGNRSMKRFEQLLRQRGMLGADERTVPAGGARLDSYGNMIRSQVVQILSQLQAFNLAGASQNATNSKRSKGKRSPVRYFYARKGEARTGRGAWTHGTKVQHLASGIWAKSGLATVKPVLIFVKGAHYRERFHFFDVARRVVNDVFPGHLAREYANAIRTSRA